MNSTRDRILAAAQRLFSERGVKTSTLKMVTEEAGVNLAAVNYHFGTKEGLTAAIFDGLAERISRRRLQLLHECEARAGGKPLPVEDIVYVFLEPYVLHEGGRDGALLINMLLHERVTPTPVIGTIVAKYFDRIATEFVRAFSASLPHLDAKTLYWRYYLMVSSILFSGSERGQGNRLARISGGNADLSDLNELAQQLTVFIAGGMAAPINGPIVKAPKLDEPAATPRQH